MPDPLNRLSNRDQYIPQAGSLPEVAKYEGKTWRYIKQGGEIFVGLFTKRIYVSLENNKIKLGKFKKSGEERTGLVVTYGLRNTIGLSDYKPYIQVFKEIKSKVSGDKNKYEIVEEDVKDAVMKQIVREKGAVFQNIFDERGLLNPELKNHEQNPIKMIFSLFENIETTIKDDQLPIDVKEALLDIVIDWAKWNDAAHLTENPDIIAKAREIRSAAKEIDALSEKADYVVPLPTIAKHTQLLQGNSLLNSNAEKLSEAFKEVLDLIKHEDVPVAIKSKLLENVIEWAKSNDASHLTENSDLIDKAREIRTAAKEIDALSEKADYVVPLPTMAYHPELFQGNGLLGLVWMRRDENTNTIIPSRAFNEILNLIKHEDVPISVKNKLLENVIEWASSSSLPKLTKNQTMINLAQQIADAAHRNEHLQENVNRLNTAINRLNNTREFPVTPLPLQVSPTALTFDSMCHKVAHEGYTKKDVQEMARALHINNIRLFRQIDLNDMNPGKEGSTVTAAPDNFNAVTYSIVIKMITELEESNPKENRKVILNLFNFFIDTANEAFKNGDTSTDMAIFAAFQISSINRILTHQTLSEYTKDIRKKILEIGARYDTSYNFKTLREAQENALKTYQESNNDDLLPPIPYMGLFMKDEVFGNDGNPDLKDDGTVNTGKLEIRKRTLDKLEVSLNELRKLSRLPETPLQSISVENPLSENELYQLSLHHFPRVSTAS